MSGEKWAHIASQLYLSGTAQKLFIQKLEKKLHDKQIMHPHLTTALNKLTVLVQDKSDGAACTTCEKCTSKCMGDRQLPSCM